MPNVGKSLVILSLCIALAGAVVWSGIGRSWFGRLPGDIHVRRGQTDFYFPVVTCILASAVLSLLSWLLRSRH
jgi:Protein of unknown function (DUF2905)